MTTDRTLAMGVALSIPQQVFLLRHRWDGKRGVNVHLWGSELNLARIVNLQYFTQTPQHF